jgi:hypothetical protein
LLPNLAKSSCGWLPTHLLHENDIKNLRNGVGLQRYWLVPINDIFFNFLMYHLLGHTLARDNASRIDFCGGGFALYCPVSH